MFQFSNNKSHLEWLIDDAPKIILIEFFFQIKKTLEIEFSAINK